MKSPITPLDAWINQKIAHQGKLTREALEHYQLEKLQETLDLARSRSPFYRKRLSAAAGTLSNLADLAQFPFTTPQDIRDQGLQLLCVSQDDIQRVVTLDTTGTTGLPKRIYFNQEDQDLTIDFFSVGMSTFTAPGDKVLILLPCERAGSVGDLLAVALERMGAYPIRHGIVRDFAETLRVMETEQVNVLVGIPVQVLGLARRSRGLTLKSILLSTDYVAQSITRVIEREWGGVVYNHYGMTEMGLGGGVECQARRGYHLREADMLFEVVHPDTGQPVAEGETGEVVFTTLTRKGMPLIRYRTGDISRFIPGDCPCGTVLKTMQQIRTRKDGMIPISSEERLTVADLDEALFSIDAVCDYEAVASHSNGEDMLHLEIYILQGAGNDLKRLIESSLDAIPSIQAARLHQRLSIEIEINPNCPAPTSSIKRKIKEVSGPMDRVNGAG